MLKKRFPQWLRKSFSPNETAKTLSSSLKDFRLNTVCQSARCPNMCECFNKGKATFLILGDTCTRHCAFCGVKKGEINRLDKDEPGRVARFIREKEIKYAVITSVTRDDLEGGGADQFAACVREIKKDNNHVKVEVLTPDFNGEKSSVAKVFQSGPDVYSHNIETVPRLYSKLRPEADYKRSLGILNSISELNGSLKVKSGIMLGLGEREGEVLDVFSDLKNAGCSTLTIGQYLRPSKDQVEVKKFIHPDIFERYRKKAACMGFEEVASAPFVRSSYIN